MIATNEQLKQWEDERAVKLMVGTMDTKKPIVYIETTPFSARISGKLRGIAHVIIVDKLPDYCSQVDELVDYATKFDSYAVLQKSRLGVDMVNCSSNNQTRKRDHGWYREFDKSSKKRNLRG
jgi:hypothetical protein